MGQGCLTDLVGKRGREEDGSWESWGSPDGLESTRAVTAVGESKASSIYNLGFTGN